MRESHIRRKTGETDITLTLNLDGTGKHDIQTGVGFFDHMLTGFARHGSFDLTVTCSGDTWVDDHHTVEDVGICLGDAFAQALGEKLGFTVTWKDGEAKLENKDIYTVVRPGDDVYFITTNHKDMVGMSAPISYTAVPYVSNGTTYVSLDFFKTLMDYQNGNITLDGSTIQINTGK